MVLELPASAVPTEVPRPRTSAARLAFNGRTALKGRPVADPVGVSPFGLRLNAKGQAQAGPTGQAVRGTDTGLARPVLAVVPTVARSPAARLGAAA